MQKWSRVLSLFMAFAMLFTSLHINAFATESAAGFVTEEEGTVSGNEIVVEEGEEPSSDNEISGESDEDFSSEEDRQQDEEIIDGNTEGEDEIYEEVVSGNELDTVRVNASEQQTETDSVTEAVPPEFHDRNDLLDFKVTKVELSEIQGEVYDAEELIQIAEDTAMFSQSYGQYWDKYTSHYIYNQLSEDERKLWRAMEILYNSYLEDEKDLYDGSTDYVTIQSTEITEGNLYGLAVMFKYTHPQYYFLMSGFNTVTNAYTSGVGLGFDVYDSFLDGTARKVETEKIQQVIDACMEMVNAKTNEEEKVLAIHDWICDKVDYNNFAYDEGIEPVEQAEYTQTAYSVMCMDRTVCAGYALSFMWLCNAADIEAFAVTGEGHAFNKVKVNDNWYNLDCTWDDKEGIGNRYYWQYLRDEEPYFNTSAHTEHDFWKEYLPECTLDSDSGYTPGQLPVITAVTETPVIRVETGEKGHTVTITSGTEGAKIYYTLDGKEPAESATRGYLYRGPFTINDQVTIKAVAVCNEKLDSDVTEQEIELIQYNQAEGTYGELTWYLDALGCLHINGAGTMPNGSQYSKAPWNSYKDSIISLEMADAITSIGDYAFYGLKNVVSYSIPQTITSIGKYAFAESGLENVAIPSGVTAVGEYAFYNCYDLKKVEIQGNVESFGRNIFFNCQNMIEIVLADELEKLGDGMFMYCTEVKKVTLPSGLVQIGSSAFEYCYDLREVVLQEGVQTIAERAFASCTALEELYVPKTVNSIGKNAFETTTALKGDGGSYVEQYAMDHGFEFVDVNQPELTPEMTEWGDIPEEHRKILQEEYGITSGEEVPKELWVVGVKDYEYTSNPVKQNGLYVYYHKKRLTLNREYTLNYRNNTRVGTAQVIVNGRGAYKGKITKEYQITPLDIKNAKVEDVVLAYNKRVQKATTKVTYVLNGKEITLQAGKDYMYRYPGTVKDDDSYDANAFKAPGGYQVEIVGKGNYTGITIFTETITEKTLISKVSLEKIPDQEYQLGTPVTPAVVLKDGFKELAEGTDYEVSYAKNTMVGTATVTITGLGDYAGTRTADFSIVGIDIKKAEIVNLQTTMEYDGRAMEQVISVPVMGENGEQISRSEGVRLVLEDGTVLEPETDFTISYKNHTKVGTATIIFTGINGYKGTVSKKYKITALDLAAAYDSGKLTITDDEKGTDGIANRSYEKTGVTPTPVLSYSNQKGQKITLVQGEDYTLRYSNNRAVAKKTDDKAPTVIITGKGCYDNTIRQTYTIVPAPLHNMEMTVKDVTWKKKGNIFPTTVTIYDRNRKLAAGTDYSKEFTYTYAKNVEVGILVDGNLVPKNRFAGEKVDVNDILPVGCEITVTVSGINNYQGFCSKTYQVLPGKTEVISVRKIELEQEKMSLGKTETRQLKLNIYPENAQVDSILWQSSNEAVASVDANGFVTAKKVGEVTIRAISMDGRKKDTCRVKIYDTELTDFLTPWEFREEDDEDDTESFNRAIKALKNYGYKTVYVPEGTYDINATRCIRLKSNTNLIMDPDATLKALPNANSWYSILYVSDVSNVSISGGTIVGERYKHKGSDGEWGMGIAIYDGRNISVSDVTAIDCWGDGIYLGTNHDDNPNMGCRDISISNCVMNNNRRNNLSITSGEDILVENCIFSNANGSAPEYGIDIETNNPEIPCEDILISNCQFYGNASAAFAIVTEADDVELKDCTLRGEFINYSGTDVVLTNTRIYDEAFARIPITINEGTKINCAGQEEDVLVATFCAGEKELTVEEYFPDGNEGLRDYNEMKASYMESPNSPSGKVLRMERLSTGNAKTGFAIPLSEMLLEAGIKLEAGYKYRFEYMVRGHGMWGVRTDQTPWYPCVPQSDSFGIGMTVYKAKDYGEPYRLFFFADENSSEMSLEVDWVKVYKIY